MVEGSGIHHQPFVPLLLPRDRLRLLRFSGQPLSTKRRVSVLSLFLISLSFTVLLSVKI